MIYLILLIMTIIGSVASLFLKKASSNLELNIKELLKNKNLFIGGLLYFISACINIYILRKLDYSIVLPLTSLTYVWTLFISSKYLKEKISTKKIIGITLIVIGAIVITL